MAISLKAENELTKSADGFGLTRYFIERLKGYRMMCKLMTFARKLPI